jgi:uncharacterized protein YggL (DUF469 family)
MFDCELGHYLTYHHVSQDFFRRHQKKYDGLIIPLSVACVFRQGTGGFVLTLKKQYALDPRTPTLQADFDRDSLRRAHREIADVHGTAVRQIIESRALRPTDVNPLARDMAARVLSFQKEFAQQSAEKVDKYAALLGEEPEERYSGPHFLMPPYFRSTAHSDPWYPVSLDLARAAIGEKGDYKIAPVLHITSGFPEDEYYEIARDYDDPGFDGLVIYVNNLQEYFVPSATLRKYANLVATLRELGKPLFGLFGGYFTLLLRKIGLGAFSNAVGYGEYRDSGYHEGGQAVRRYYLPRLHRYFSDTEAQAILDFAGGDQFRCACAVCRRRRPLTDFTSQELLDHFLYTRLLELQQARATKLSDLLDELEQTGAQLEDFPIPFDTYSHLGQWAEALRDFA